MKIPAIPELPDMIDIEGCTISIDVMGFQSSAHLILQKEVYTSSTSLHATKTHFALEVLKAAFV